MYHNFSYNVNFGQNMMASMIQAIQASKSSESSLASLRNLRTFLLLIEINMLGTNLETGSHIYPWLWSNQCRWSLTPKLYVQNHQIHQKKTVLQKRLLVQRWHPSASLRPNLTFLLRKNLPGEIGVFLILDISKLFCLPLHHVYPCWKMRMSIHELSVHLWMDMVMFHATNGSWHLNPTRGLLNLNNRYTWP